MSKCLTFNTLNFKCSLKLHLHNYKPPCQVRMQTDETVLPEAARRSVFIIFKSQFNETVGGELTRCKHWNSNRFRFHLQRFWLLNSLQIHISYEEVKVNNWESNFFFKCNDLWLHSNPAFKIVLVPSPHTCTVKKKKLGARCEVWELN